jgi:hypothetical protein
VSDRAFKWYVGRPGLRMGRRAPARGGRLRKGRHRWLGPASPRRGRGVSAVPGDLPDLRRR